MNTFTTILFGLVILLYLKWILIILVFPFQVMHGQILKKWGKATGRRASLGNESKSAPLVYRVLNKPYDYWEKLFHKGWQRYMLFQISLVPSHHLRKFVYKALGAQIGKNVVFHFKTEIRGIHKLKIGKGTIVGDNALLDARRGLTIGNNVIIASNVTIHPGGHDIRDPYFRPPAMDSSPVVIGDRVYIGARAMILNGVTIGEGAVLCAGCIVTKDVEPYTVVAGIPAKKINERPRDLRYESKGRAQRLY